MRSFILYILLALGAYVCHTVLFPVLLIPELRVDLFLILLLHASFSYERSKTFVLSLFFGLLMDVGFPLKGCYYPLTYLGIAFLASLLGQNLNLHARRYQALFLGLFTLLAGGGVWSILWLQGAEFAETPYILRILAVRTLTIVLVGPLLLAGLERLSQWLNIYDNQLESQET